MTLKHFAKLYLVGALFLFLPSCLSPAPDPTGSGIAISTVNTVAGDLYFKVETAREDRPEVKTTKLTCQIFAGDPASKTCTLTIPEEELFYSKFYMTFGASSGTGCKVINFTPFAYLGSYSATFKPPWLSNPSAIDCNVDTAGESLSADCYNGAAKEILPSFPQKTSRYFFPEEGVEGKFATKSPQEAGMAFDNTWITNNLVDPTTAILQGTLDRYVGTANGLGTDLVYQDWSIACLDEWYEPIYQITVRINDEDITGGDLPGDAVLDDMYDWEGL